MSEETFPEIICRTLTTDEDFASIQIGDVLFCNTCRKPYEVKDESRKRCPNCDYGGD